MVTIAATRLDGIEETSVIETTLTGTSDTFVFDRSRRQTLILRNATAGALTPTLTGSDAGTVTLGGIGDVDLSTGWSPGAISVGGVIAVRPVDIKKYLAGTIAISGGTGLVAVLLEE
ncbi:MAG: hypothetical protein ABJN39_09325 [Sulfitobacter sp.]|uniref:hypothetical protein n=1 Tax=Alphaproteobacteria TaxID=28211 RepID=UPI0029420AE1|nr:hypothetical protein [Sulfitobacter sp. LC.270.F.C4]WOI13575.1 hypothetical protein R1T45_01725 [Sulfitobacter sp. LC.270.F.C4]